MAVLEQPDRLRWPVAALVCALALLALATPASAETIRVTSRADQLANDAACTLREAVISANVDVAVLGCTAGRGDDVIVLGGGSYPLTIDASATPFDAGSGSLDAADPQGSALAIGSFLGHSTIDASAIADRAIAARSALELNNVTVTGGDSSTSPEAPAGAGGAVAVFDGAALTIRRSLLAHNSATLAGGAVYASGPLQISGSTLTANSVQVPVPAAAPAGGGGAIDAGGPAIISGSTIAANTVSSPDATGVGGGIRYAAALTVTRSIIADNSADGGGSGCSGSGGVSAGFNVIENAAAGCAITLAASDSQADPALQPIADNGGGTRTMAIGAASPAANIGPGVTGGCAGTDQRGAPRGVAESGACDAGAYEISYCALFPVNEIGGGGSDTMHSSRPHAYMAGLAGRDTIFGGSGSDALCGGAGIDTLQGGGGADVLVGGPDVDITSYGDAAAPVAVRLDNLANDGRAGEGDNVQTESVIGGPAADALAGSGGPNGIQGGAGNDGIDGGAGNDSVLGGPGNDVVNGNAGNDQVRGDGGVDTLLGLDGNDRLEGGDGNDKLDGGPGNDKLFGGEGKNKLLGGDGNDTLVGGLSRDTFKCGKGRDTAIAIGKDKVARDCERVTRTGAGKGGKGKRSSARALLIAPGI